MNQTTEAGALRKTRLRWRRQRRSASEKRRSVVQQKPAEAGRRASVRNDAERKNHGLAGLPAMKSGAIGEQE